MVRIFVSAVTSELKPARDIAARVLRTIGYEPVYQDEFPTGAGDLRAFLRDLIDPCVGVLQLVGHRYGAEPAEVDPAFGRVSYTQYEAEHARRCGKKVWYILLDEAAAVPGVPAEDEVKRGLQAAYRDRVEKGPQLYHHAANPTELELKIHRLRDELLEFRNRIERRGRRILALAIAGVIMTVGIAWGVWRLAQKQGEVKQQVDKVAEENAKLHAALRDFSQAMFESKQWSGTRAGADDEPTLLKATYARLAEKHGIDAAELERELPRFATELLARKDTSALDRANALFVRKLYAAAEKEALAAKEKALTAAGKPVDDALDALMVAGRSAREQIRGGNARAHYERGLEHFRAAAALTSEGRNPARWADVQDEICTNLRELGRADEAIPLQRKLTEVRRRVLGAADPDTLRSENNLAVLLQARGDYAEAETKLRGVAELAARALGKTHPCTLGAQHNLAYLFFDEGKFTDAEPLFRQVLKIREQTLGNEHPETLSTVDGLATLLQSRGDLAGAEQLSRRALASREKTLGKEHPETIRSVGNLASILTDKGDLSGAIALSQRAVEASDRVLGREHPETLAILNNHALLLEDLRDYPQAESLYRRVLEARERTLGPQHSSTLATLNNLGALLSTKRDYAAAESFLSRALAGNEARFGPDHPNTLTTLNNLALLAVRTGNLDRAEALFRRVLDAQQRVLGRQHPSTCLSAYNLGRLLFDRGKTAEVPALARQAYEGWLRAHGPNHENTRDAAEFLRRLREPPKQ